MTIPIPGLERVFRGDKPVYLAITEVLADAIADGHLGQGTRLPTHRQFAERLGVTTATVTRAYIEAERRGGLRDASTSARSCGRGRSISPSTCRR
jgi:DNA-binding transcriptional regulator YhcF (GntR family)